MRFKDNIFVADLPEIGSFFSKNQGVKYLLCVIDGLIKHVWVKPLMKKRSYKQSL